MEGIFFHPDPHELENINLDLDLVNLNGYHASSMARHDWQALTGLKKTKEAKAVKAEFDAAWAEADVTLTAPAY